LNPDFVGLSGKITDMIALECYYLWDGV